MVLFFHYAVFRADLVKHDAILGDDGFGLGLAIAENIASIHKGTLRAESDAVSTRFIFTMPLRR